MPAEALSPKKVAEVLGCTRRTVYRLISAGKLPAFYVGADIRITKADLLAFKDRNKYHVRNRRREVANGHRGSLQRRAEKEART